jgi:dTDP-4-dehydrorhamnose reductase
LKEKSFIRLGKELKTMETTAITGASGLLGSAIVKFAKNNYNVIPLHNAKQLHSDSIKLDITNRDQVLSIFTKLKTKIVIHTASETNVDKCEIRKKHAWKVNVEGTSNIVEACNKTSAKLIYISTDYVFDGEKGNYTEEDITKPVNYYGKTKLEGENQVTERCKDYAVLRTSVLYGWHPWKQNFATWLINQLKQDKEVTVVDDHFNTPTLVDNLAEMIIEIIKKDLTGLYHASGSERISRYDFAKRTAETFDLDASLIKPAKMSQLTAWIAKRPKDSSLNTEKIQKKLKTKPLNTIQGLKRMKEEVN